MAYSYMDITHETQSVTMAGLDPAFFVVVPYTEKRGAPDGRVYDFNSVYRPKGVLVDDYNVQLDIPKLRLPSGMYRLWRCTRFDRMLYDFVAGSRFDARTYQRNWTQLLHLYQEIVEGRVVLDLVGTGNT